MATATVAHHDTEVHGHQDHHDHEHHDNFITKYLFTTDHKMIAKQFLVTGMFWALIGGLLSTLFRLQLGFPDMNLEVLHPLHRYLLGRKKYRNFCRTPTTKQLQTTQGKTKYQ